VNKPKAQGTAFETQIVNRAHARGLQAWRLAEGGQRDAGDVVLVDSDGDHWVIEAKHRENLSAHQALHKAQAKADKADLPFVAYTTALIWKRSTSRGQGQRRTPEGTIVILGLEDFLGLLQ
jgi:hypothetical protein